MSSGERLFLEAYLQVFNILYTGLPVIIFATFDQDVTKRESGQTPALYTTGIKRVYYTHHGFVRWMAEALFTAFLCTYVPALALGYPGWSLSAPDNGDPAVGVISLTAMLLVCIVINLRLAMEVHSWHALDLFFFVASIVSIEGSCLVFSYVWYQSTWVGFASFGWNSLHAVVKRVWDEAANWFVVCSLRGSRTLISRAPPHPHPHPNRFVFYLVLLVALAPRLVEQCWEVVERGSVQGVGHRRWLIDEGPNHAMLTDGSRMSQSDRPAHARGTSGVSEYLSRPPAARISVGVQAPTSVLQTHNIVDAQVPRMAPRPAKASPHKLPRGSHVLSGSLANGLVAAPLVVRGAPLESQLEAQGGAVDKEPADVPAPVPAAGGKGVAKPRCASQAETPCRSGRSSTVASRPRRASTGALGAVGSSARESERYAFSNHDATSEHVFAQIMPFASVSRRASHSIGAGPAPNTVLGGSGSS